MFIVKKGFTLAEVLITLLIVGVIASIVIPGLIADTQNAEYKTAWKKGYADLSQATKRILMDNGGTLKGICTNSNCLRDLYLQYLNFSKKCDAGTTLGNCFDSTTKALSGAVITGDWFTSFTSYSGVILANGNFVLFVYNSNCNWTPTISNVCGSIITDINGFRGPNTFGKDIYKTYILQNSIPPFGVQGDGNESDCNTNPPSGSGLGCSARYLYQ